jgi:integrase
MQIRRRGDKWYLRGTFSGQRFEVCTGLTDKKAAEAWAREYQRDLADPAAKARRAARSTTVEQALELATAHHEGEHRAGNIAAATLSFYRKKLGVILSTLGTSPDGAPALLVDVTAAVVDRYIATRRDEGASQHTIYKELGVLAHTLKLAKRAGLWAGHVAEVMPPRFSPKYEPRTRALSVLEVQQVLAALDPDRGAWVALAVGGGAELAALERAERGDWREGADLVRVRGTKNDRRDREVPIVLDVCRDLVRFAWRHGAGAGQRLLRPWAKNWRDLDLCAARIQIEPFSLHSLRHTFATWHLAAGCAWDDVARALGHADTSMLHKIYGHLKPEELRARLAALLAPPVPHKAVQGMQTGHRVHGSSKDKTPSGEGVSGCRRSELNQRPWDYDSKGPAVVKHLFTPGIVNRRTLRKAPSAPPVPRSRRSSR